MKKILVVISMAIFSSISFAASSGVFKAVLAAPGLKYVQDIHSIKVVAAYRCPNCFDILVEGTNLYGDAYAKLRTSSKVGGEIDVKLLETSK